MAFEVRFLDCCGHPHLDAEKVLYVEHYSPLRLCRCRNCGTFWFTWIIEDFYESEPNRYIVWFVHIAKEEAEAFIEKSQIPDMDSKECFFIDNDVVEKTVVPPF